MWFIVFRCNIEEEPAVFNSKPQSIRPPLTLNGSKIVALDQIVDSNLALMLNGLGALERSRIVKVDTDKKEITLAFIRVHGLFVRSFTAFACASSPSACARVMAAGASFSNASGGQHSRVVRLRKSRVDKPEVKRALPLVGNT